MDATVSYAPTGAPLRITRNPGFASLHPGLISQGPCRGRLRVFLTAPKGAGAFPALQRHPLAHACGCGLFIGCLGVGRRLAPTLVPANSLVSMNEKLYKVQPGSSSSLPGFEPPGVRKHLFDWIP
jgi:hypothetical protein